jgi:hypothetical protein
MARRKRGNKLERWEAAVVKAMLERGDYNDQESRNQKKQNPAADVAALEAVIDAEVYKLYDLTAAERALIKSATKNAQKKAA